MGTINHALPDIITLSLAFLIISCTLDDPVQFTLTTSFNEESHQSTPQVLRAENRALILIIQTQLNHLSVFVFGLILMHDIFVPSGRFIITFNQRAYSHPLSLRPFQQLFSKNPDELFYSGLAPLSNSNPPES